MIRSMTGYGINEITRAEKSLSVEIRSLNHRYCEVNVRLPKKLFFLENEIKNRLKATLLRGKIDVYINLQTIKGSSQKVQCNEALVEQYVTELKKMSVQFLLEDDLTISNLLRLPDVFIPEEETLDDFIEDLVLETLEGAIAKIISAKEMEGQLLKEDILKKLDYIEQLIQPLPELEKKSIEDYRVKLNDKINELLENESVDENRLLTEVAIMADRLSVDEEIVRLQGHLVHMRNTLEEKNSIGKKLDFIIQEMNRETNTILAKAMNMQIKEIGIEAKNVVEKIREQVQNIE